MWLFQCFNKIIRASVIVQQFVVDASLVAVVDGIAVGVFVQVLTFVRLCPLIVDRSCKDYLFFHRVINIQFAFEIY